MTHERDITKWQEVETEVQQFIYDNQEIAVTTREQYQEAGDIIKVVNMKIKKVDEKRKQYTKPLDESKVAIMADAKAIMEPLERFVDEVKSKMLEFHKAETARIAEEQRKIDAEALAKAKAEGASEVTVPVLAVEKKSHGELSTTSVVKRWTYEVTAESQVPREFLAIDSVKVRKAIAEGARLITGLKVFQEESIVSR